MALNPADMQQLQGLVQNVPLAATQPGFILDLAANLTRADVAKDTTIFDPNDPTSPVGKLYLLAEGTVVQTMGASGQPWYRKTLVPGEFFGQRSMVSGRHDSRAVATAPSVLYQMSASELSPLLDRYPDFRDFLWKESLAGRLRSIPLFESLSDTEISWLSELVDEVALPAGALVPLDSQPGLWVLNWGQAAVTGPAASVGGGTAEWLLTAGNFFLTLQQGLSFGATCAATTARVVRASRFFFLADRHFNRLIAAQPSVKSLISAPLDIPAWLAAVPLFSGRGMTPEHRQHLAGLCAWAFVPANQNISTQGTVGYSFVELLKGGALITAVDDKGRLRPVQLLQPGGYYGETSLLESKRRDATVRAVSGAARNGQAALNGAEILNLDRRDLQVAFNERPDLWRSGVELFDRYRQIVAVRPRYAWMDEGESLYWTNRRHWWWLVGPLLLETVSLFITIGLISLFGGWFSLSLRSEVVISLLIALLIYLPIILYTYYNYQNDYYAITNRRVTRHDQVLFAQEARIDAPLEMVQDVTAVSWLLGRIFDYGNVTIRTAAKVGSIIFEFVPNPDAVQGYITSARAEAAIAQRGYTKEALRRGLMNDLSLAMAIPDLDSVRALGENVVPQLPATPWQRFRHWLGLDRPRKVPVRRSRPLSWTRNLVPPSWRKVLFGPPPKPPKPVSLSSGEIVWQKHWVNLVRRSWGAILFTGFVVISGLLLFALRPSMGDSFAAFFLPWLLLLIPIDLFWLWYNYVDWRNDLYIVTDEKIIDLEQKPLALSSRQRESSLEVIQTVDSNQPSIWAKIFNYGNVVIRTAATDEGFTFYMVPAPMLVQKTIFQRIDAYRRRQEDRRLEERRRSVVEGLQVYHELQQDGLKIKH
jgi:CRP-like cAMP-binding protein/membrane protein YdbS with pleckstrin-like domain